MASVFHHGAGSEGLAPAVETRKATRMETLFNISVFVLFAALWAGFAFALLASQGSIDSTWEWIRSQPWFVQGVVWLLFLPVTAGVWIWEAGWPLAVRLVFVAGLAFFNLYLFFPKELFAGRG
jgi:hypothetical protein